MIRRRRLLTTGAALLTLPAIHPARADGMMNLLVGAPAGSVPDVQACSFAPFLERHLPRTQIGVRDVAGEAGVAAYRALADAAPDGTLLGWVATPVLTARMIDRGGGALMDRLVLLGAVQQEPILLVASPDSPDDLNDLIQLVSNEGGAMALATPPAGSAGHLSALRLQAVLRRKAGAEGATLNIVAFPSEQAARQAAIAGNVAAAMLPQGIALDAVRDGRLDGAAIAAASRSAVLQDVPSFRESGIDFIDAIRRGVAAPAGLPQALSAPLVDALRAVVRDPEFQDQGKTAGFTGEWLSGADWTTQAGAERMELSRLWQQAPWLNLGNG